MIDYFCPESHECFDTFSLYQILDTKEYELTQKDTNWMDSINENSKNNPFSGKIVIIGTTLSEHNDYKKVPFNSFGQDKLVFNGVEYQAQAIQTLLSKNYINYFPNDSTQYNSEFRDIAIDGKWTIY